MSTELLYTGADVSGRDELLTKSAGTSREGGVFQIPIARVTSAAIFAIAVVVAATTAPVVHYAAEVVDLPIPVHRGGVEDQIAWANSERLQPSDDARATAFEVLALMEKSGLQADRAVGDPDGGIALYVFGGKRTNAGHPRYGRIVVTNEHDVVAMCVDHGSKKQKVWDAAPDLEASVQRIRRFVIG